MNFICKNYRNLKTKNFLKKNRLIFFMNIISMNSNEWFYFQQRLKKENFNYYKIFNKTTKKILTDSIYKTIKFIPSSVLFLIKPNLNIKKSLTKQILINNFKFFALKLNNNTYHTIQLIKNYSLNYYSSSLLIFQFINSHLKIKSK